MARNLPWRTGGSSTVAKVKKTNAKRKKPVASSDGEEDTEGSRPKVPKGRSTRKASNSKSKPTEETTARARSNSPAEETEIE